MNTAMMALLSVLSVAGVGTAAVAGSQMQAMGGGMMMNGGMMGGGMHNGQGSMHGGMQGHCPCCDYDDVGNDTAGGGQGQLTYGP